MVLRECPVRLITPEAEALVALFKACYQPRIVPTLGGAFGRWERTALPAAGGIEDQPARQMEALALLERWFGEELAEDLRG